MLDTIASSETMLRQAITTALRQARRVALAIHFNPDGDAVGSGLALLHTMRALGKECFCYCKDPTPFNYHFCESDDARVVCAWPGGDWDITCVLDASELERAVPDTVHGNLGTVINIDHHLTSRPFGHLNWIDPTAAATGILVGELIDELGVPISAAIATALYTALLTDTGSFRYSNTDGRAMRWAARLLDHGAKPWEIAEQVYESMPRARLAILAQCLKSMVIAPSGKWAAIQVRLRDMDKLGVTVDMLDGLINYPRSVAGVEVAVMYREAGPQKWKIGFRSRGSVNVATIASRFGGGGHHNAAGGFLTGSLASVRRRVEASIEAELALLPGAEPGGLS